MATVIQDLQLKLQTTKDGDIETVDFKAGDALHVIQKWARFYLVKDDNGHFYNIPKDKLEG